MVVRGRVQDGVVVLANGVRLPEGQEVTVLADATYPLAPRIEGSRLVAFSTLRRERGLGTSSADIRRGPARRNAGRAAAILGLDTGFRRAGIRSHITTNQCVTIGQVVVPNPDSSRGLYGRLIKYRGIP